MKCNAFLFIAVIVIASTTIAKTAVAEIVTLMPTDVGSYGSNNFFTDSGKAKGAGLFVLLSRRKTGRDKARTRLKTILQFYRSN